MTENDENKESQRGSDVPMKEIKVGTITTDSQVGKSTTTNDGIRPQVQAIIEEVLRESKADLDYLKDK